MVDSVPGAYNNLVLPPFYQLQQLQYFNTPSIPSTHRPMDRRISNGRRERMTYDRNQLKTLEDQFKITPYPDASKREMLAKLLHLEENRIQVWFKNRRAKQRSQGKVPGVREDGGSSSVSPKDQQPRFKPVSELPFIPMPTPPKEEEIKIEEAASSAFTSIKKETEEMAAQPVIPTNMDYWSNYYHMFPHQMFPQYPTTIDYANFTYPSYPNYQ